MRNRPRLRVLQARYYGQVRLHQRLLESQAQSIPPGVDDQHSCLDSPAGLEPLLRVLQHDVGVVIGPHDSIDATRDRDEETLVTEVLDGTLHALANLYVSNIHELLAENALLERELYDAIHFGESDDAGTVNRPNFPRSGSRR